MMRPRLLVPPFFDHQRQYLPAAIIGITLLINSIHPAESSYGRFVAWIISAEVSSR